MGTGSPVHVGGDIVGKDLQRAPDHTDGAVGMPARPASLHLVEAAEEPGQEMLVRPARREQGQVSRDGRKAVRTRAALS